MTKRPIDQLFENLNELPILDPTPEQTVVEVKIDPVQDDRDWEEYLKVSARDKKPTKVLDVETMVSSGPLDTPLTDFYPRIVPRYDTGAVYEQQGTGYDSGAAAHEVQGRETCVRQPPPTESKLTSFRYNEGKYLDEARDFIGGTYNAHYAKKGGFQVYDSIHAVGYGVAFSLSSIMKYAGRFGKKEGQNRKDLLKIIHYATMALYSLDNDS